MKRAWLILGTLILIVFASTAVWATPAEVRFLEQETGEPATDNTLINVKTANFTVNGFAAPTKVEGIEYGTAKGSFSFLKKEFGWHAVEIQEPNVKDEVSDVLLVYVTPRADGKSGVTTYESGFFSDGFNSTAGVKIGSQTFKTFDGVVLYVETSISPHDEFIELNEQMKILTLNTPAGVGNLVFHDFSSTAPIPGTAMLLVTGLTGLIVSGRRKS